MTSIGTLAWWAINQRVAAGGKMKSSASNTTPPPSPLQPMSFGTCVSVAFSVAAQLCFNFYFALNLLLYPVIERTHTIPSIYLFCFDNVIQLSQIRLESGLACTLGLKHYAWGVDSMHPIRNGDTNVAHNPTIRANCWLVGAFIRTSKMVWPPTKSSCFDRFVTPVRGGGGGDACRTNTVSNASYICWDITASRSQRC